MVDVSVIVTAYNEAGHISRCLDSLLRQDFESFEVLVVDDGSVDGTSEVVKQYVLRYPGKVRSYLYHYNPDTAGKCCGGISG
jgi:glycosyltransferase involved in cell wall biosynthesis